MTATVRGLSRYWQRKTSLLSFVSLLPIFRRILDAVNKVCSIEDHSVRSEAALHARHRAAVQSAGDAVGQSVGHAVPVCTRYGARQGGVVQHSLQDGVHGLGAARAAEVRDAAGAVGAGKRGA